MAADHPTGAPVPRPLLASAYCPHWHLTEAEAVALVADLPRPELLGAAAAAASAAASRDGRQGHELPNRNALLIAVAALHVLLWSGPRLAAVKGGAA
jgi:hypothetical protein